MRLYRRGWPNRRRDEGSRDSGNERGEDILKRSRSSMVGWVNVLAVAGMFGMGCRAQDGSAPNGAEDLTSVRSALSGADGGVTSANLPLQVSKNFCSTTVAQDYFKL